MGNFKFVCPFCSQKLECDNELENQICPCPNCNNEIVPERNKFEGKIKISAPEIKPNPPLRKTLEFVPPDSKQQQIIINNYTGGNPAMPNYPIGSTGIPRQRIIYIILGIFLGALGIHNFYAGYKTEGAIQLVAWFFGILLIGADIPLGLLLCFGSEVWALANIICRNKDAAGRPMV